MILSDALILPLSQLQYRLIIFFCSFYSRNWKKSKRAL